MHYWHIPGDLTRDLWNALKHERAAIENYTLLAELAPDPIRKGTLFLIRRDKEISAVKLSKMLTYYTGQPPQEFVFNHADFVDFTHGLATMLVEEEEMYDFYGSIMLKTPNTDTYFELALIQKDIQLHLDLLTLLQFRKS